MVVVLVLEFDELASGMVGVATEERRVDGSEPGLGGAGQFNTGDGIGFTKGRWTLRIGERSGAKCLLTLSVKGWTLRSTGEGICLYGKGDL